MTVRLSCRAGHEWETVETAGAVSTVCPVCGDTVALAGESVGPSLDTASFAAAGDDLPPLPEAVSASESTVHFAQAETIETEVDGLAMPGYRIVRELGRGGMGVVYLASQTSLNRQVAVKLVRAGVDADDPEVDRFRAEAEAVASLQHSNVVQVFEVGTHEGRPYFTQEYLGGGDLAERIGGTPWLPDRAAGLVESLALAVQYAHNRGIVHRDLKPANILFTDADDLATAKITDFGIAKRLDVRSDRTKTGMIIGSPSYMAPEQAAGMSREVGPRADVYALGAILYELLTGRPPFRAATAMETVQQVVHDDPIPPARLVPRLPRDVETICLKCLEKSPPRRYATAAALAEDLRRFQTNEPILARPVNASEKLRKWTRRRPAVAALIGVSFLGLVSATAFGLRYQHDLKQERDAAQAARSASDRRYAQAIGAVDAMLFRLAAVNLESVPKMDELRVQLLEDALALCLDFREEEGDDPRLLGQASQIAERIGSMLMSMGRFEEAEQTYRKAITWQEELLASSERESASVLRRLLALSHNNLGLLYGRTGKLEQARSELAIALDLRDKLRKSEPNDPEYQYEVAASHLNLALVERFAGRQTQVEAHLSEAVRLCKTLVRDGPTHGKYLQCQATAGNDLGVLYLESARLREAIAAFEESLAAWKRLTDANPAGVAEREGLARCLSNLGYSIVQDDGDLADAHDFYDQALEIRRRLEEEHPQQLFYAVDVSWSCVRLGQLCLTLGEYEPCRRWCTQAIDKLLFVQSQAPSEQRILAPLQDAYTFRAMAAEGLGLVDEARKDLDAIQSLKE